MQPVPIEMLLKAALVGARRLGTATGQVYQRRQLTAKQQKLLTLLADGDSVGLDDLVRVFKAEWDVICRAHPHRELSRNQAALFQNLADLAARLNAYLLAGFKDHPTRKRMLALLGDRLVAIQSSFERHELWLIEATDLADLAGTVPSGAASHPGQRNRAKPLATAQAPLPDPAHLATPEHTGVTAGVTTQGTPATQAEGLTPPQAQQPAPLVLLARVDRVTNRWTLEIKGTSLEVDPALGMVRLGTEFRRWLGDALPADPEACTPDQIRLLEAMAASG